MPTATLRGSASSPAFTLAPGERITVRPTTGVDVYVWAAEAGSAIVYDDALQH